MFDKYRVVCSENLKLYPDKLFIDIYPAGSSRPENCLNHECILQMRRVVNPDVSSLASGIILTDRGNGDIFLQYEKVTNYRLKQYQEYIRSKVDNKIIETFKKMKALGKNRTLEVSLSSMAVLFDLQKRPDTPVSAREDALQKEADHQRKLKAALHYRQVYHASQKNASHPEIMLAWKQAMYRGG